MERDIETGSVKRGTGIEISKIFHRHGFLIRKYFRD